MGCWGVFPPSSQWLENYAFRDLSFYLPILPTILLHFPSHFLLDFVLFWTLFFDFSFSFFMTLVDVEVTLGAGLGSS